MNPTKVIESLVADLCFEMYLFEVTVHFSFVVNIFYFFLKIAVSPNQLVMISCGFGDGTVMKMYCFI